MTYSTKKIPQWLIERAAQEELDGGEIEDLRSRLAAEGRSLDEELEHVRRSNREILAELPRETMGAAIRRRAATEDRSAPRLRLNMVFVPLALAGSLGLVVLGVRMAGDDHVIKDPVPRFDEDVVIKGDSPQSPQLLVYRQRPGQPSVDNSERLSDGSRGSRGDVLQLAYAKAPEGLHGVLVSIDGAGKVTQHLPEEGATLSAPLASVREIRLPSAYELDDAPGFERFVLVTAPQSFSIAVVLEAARGLAGRGEAAKTQSLALGPHFRQTSLLLNKMREGNP